jgi:hypothetical protein
MNLRFIINERKCDIFTFEKKENRILITYTNPMKSDDSRDYANYICKDSLNEKYGSENPILFGLIYLLFEDKFRKNYDFVLKC